MTISAALLLLAGLAASTMGQTTGQTEKEYVCPEVAELCKKPMGMGMGTETPGILEGNQTDQYPTEGKDSQCVEEKALEEYHKCIVRNGYLRLYNDLDVDSADCFFCKDLIQHNPYETDGVDGLKNWARQYNKNITKGVVDIKRMTGDGDVVWTHVKFPVAKQSPEEEQKFYAAMDVFRIEGDCIAEHWDVIQRMTPPSQSANPHPHF